ncbi:RHS repeat-associated core domain-containing protein [Acinetobacter sp. VNK23]|uniref:RHS repeat-associated core domain-containing protein n=1 Tax=Acinetobacter thutiue TaxID=2998078 RepID=UPI002574BB6A|nr:RHS repeat-associated core domain-containing protein [Acinetobacter thutiue]MDM1022278.1 RHS repeat-associated core domain-containing protein [Acinetobacter thutiue]
MRWEGDQFGDVLPTGNLTFPIRHAGQYYDSETGIFYNYFRDYDPITGRYVESDPIGLDGGLNTYGYVGGNPLHLIDPLGLLQEAAKNVYVLL